MALILSAAWLALIIWLILRAVRQRNILPRLSPSTAPPVDLPAVAIIIPARDEGENIGPCIRSLLQQDYPPDRLRLIVIDDESADDTATVVTALARTNTRITLLHTPPLPPAWKGKVNACYTGVSAVPAEIEWLCFLDADMRAEPELIANAINTVIKKKLDLLSLAPRHQLGSFAERLMIPCGLYLLSFSQDLAHIQSPNSDLVAATGQFMLLRRRVYDDVGGHSAVHAAICEDVELARLIKGRGHRVLLMDGSGLLSTRMYTGWRTLWPGIAKNLTDMLGGPVATVATALLAVSLAWLAVILPLIDFVSCMRGTSESCLAVAPALLGSLAAFSLHLAGAVYFRIPLWYGLLFPVGYTIGAVIALDSLRWRWIGRVRWKGRSYQ